MNTETINPYTMPQKVQGKRMESLHFRAEPAYIRALTVMSKKETERLGVFVSRWTIMNNLARRDSIEIRRIRSEFNREIERQEAQLNKEKHHGYQKEPSPITSRDSS